MIPLDDLLTLYTPDALVTEILVREIQPIPIWFTREKVTFFIISSKTNSYFKDFISTAIKTLDFCLEVTFFFAHQKKL